MKLLLHNRRWLGLALVLAGAGLTTVHYIDYGYTAHFTMPDHGLVGIILMVAGGFLGIGKPGAKQS